MVHSKSTHPIGTACYNENCALPALVKEEKKNEMHVGRVNSTVPQVDILTLDLLIIPFGIALKHLPIFSGCKIQGARGALGGAGYTAECYGQGKQEGAPANIGRRWNHNSSIPIMTRRTHARTRMWACTRARARAHAHAQAYNGIHTVYHTYQEHLFIIVQYWLATTFVP